MANAWHTLSGNTVALDLFHWCGDSFAPLALLSLALQRNLRSLDVKLWPLKFGKEIARFLSSKVLLPLKKRLMEFSKQLPKSYEGMLV